LTVRHGRNDDLNAQSSMTNWPNGDSDILALSRTSRPEHTELP
jgi:hypothetical protein